MTSDNAIPVAAPRDTTRLYFDDGSAFGVQHAKPSTSVSTERAWDDGQLLDAAHQGASGHDLHPDLIAALCVRYVDLATAENIREADVRTATVRVQDAEKRLAVAQGVAAGLQERVDTLQLELEGCRLALDEERNAHMGTMFAREFAEDMHVAEMTERNRVAQMHAEASGRAAALVVQLAQVSAENVELRHQIAGTASAGIRIALDRAARTVVDTGAEELTVELNDQLRRYPTVDGRFDHSEPDAADTVVMAVEDLGLGLEVGCG